MFVLIITEGMISINYTRLSTEYPPYQVLQCLQHAVGFLYTALDDEGSFHGSYL